MTQPAINDSAYTIHSCTTPVATIANIMNAVAANALWVQIKIRRLS